MEKLAGIRTESGASLLGLAEESPILMVFLRHFGCTFCRQAIADVAGLRGELEGRGVKVVFVHLGTPEIAKAHFDFYKLQDVERVHDPEAEVYRVFELTRTNPLSHFVKAGPLKSWFLKGALFRHGFGKIEGDGSQMPGVFFLKGAKVVRKFVHRDISDRPDYVGLVS